MEKNGRRYAAPCAAVLEKKKELSRVALTLAARIFLSIPSQIRVFSLSMLVPSVLDGLRSNWI